MGERAVAPRLLLSDFLRHELALTGTHVGCEHGVCGACTILFDGEAAGVFVSTDGLAEIACRHGFFLVQRVEHLCNRYRRGRV